MIKRAGKRRAIGWALALCLSASPLIARAEATVKVQLRGPDGKPADGQVQLKRGEVTYGCETRAGVCQIAGVAGGLYTVTVAQAGKPAPKSQQVMIPPSGEVSLILRGS